jgi:hypothetical protein
MNYIPLVFVLCLFEVSVFVSLLFLTIYTYTSQNKINTKSYLLQMFCGLLLMVVLALGAGKLIIMNDNNTKVEQESTK